MNANTPRHDDAIGYDPYPAEPSRLMVDFTADADQDREVLWLTNTADLAVDGVERYDDTSVIVTLTEDADTIDVRQVIDEREGVADCYGWNDEDAPATFDGGALVRGFAASMMNAAGRAAL